MDIDIDYVFAPGDKDFEGIHNRQLVFDEEHIEHKVQIVLFDNIIRETIKKIFSVHLSLLSGVRTHLMASAIDVTIAEDDGVHGKQLCVPCF